MKAFHVRRFPRHSCLVEVHLKSINKNDESLQHSRINIQNISEGGVGFTSNTELKVGFFYEFEITLWGTNTIQTVIKVIRKEEMENEFRYGAEFVGLTEGDIYVIKTYDIFCNVRKEEKECDIHK